MRKYKGREVGGGGGQTDSGMMDGGETGLRGRCNKQGRMEETIHQLYRQSQLMGPGRQEEAQKVDRVKEMTRNRLTGRSRCHRYRLGQEPRRSSRLAC